MLEKIMKDGLKAGAYLTVVSWENDGDNYATKMVHYPTLDQALLDSRLLTACAPMYNSGGHDLREGRLKAFSAIVQVLKDHREQLDKNLLPVLDHIINHIGGDDDGSIHVLYELWDYIDNLSYSLMGSSEYYCMRVAESITVNLVEEDVKVNAKLIETTRPNH